MLNKKNEKDKMFALDDINNPNENENQQNNMDIEDPPCELLPINDNPEADMPPPEVQEHNDIDDLVEFLTSEDEEDRKKKEQKKWIKIEGPNSEKANAKTDKEKEIEFNLNKMDERLGEIGFGKPLDNLDQDKA